MDRGWRGLYLKQAGKDYQFLRFYPDGDVLLASVGSSDPRRRVIDSVRGWLHREGKKQDRAAYRLDGDGICFDYANTAKSFSVRGERDALGRVALIWHQHKTDVETLRVYSPLGEPGDVLPVFLNVADVHELSELPGVAKGLAERVVQHREQHGPFQSVDALLDIKGFTKAKLEACRARCDASPAPRLGIAVTPPPPLVVTRELLAGVLKEKLGPRVDPTAPTLRTLGRFEVGT